MRKHTLNLMGVTLLALFLVACNGGTVIQIASPVNGSLYQQPPAQFRLTYNSQPVDAVVVLNGFPVQDYFTFGPSEAVADGEVLKDFLVQGSNVLQVNPKTFGPKSVFTYDSTGPELIISSVSDTNPMELRGELRDPHGVDYFSINGVPVDVSNGKFIADVDPATLYEFYAEDTLGHTATTRYAAPDTFFSDSIKARVGQEGLDNVAPAVAEQIKDATISQEMLDTFNPLLDGQFTWTGLFGEPYGLEAYLDSLEIGSVAINNLQISQNTDGTLAINVDVYDMYVHMVATIFNGLIPLHTNIPLGMSANNVHVTGTVKMAVTDGQIDITFPHLLANMNGTHVNFDHIPDSFENIFAPIADPLTEALLDVMKGFISSFVAEKMEAVLKRELKDLIVKTTIRIGDVGLGMDAKLEQLGTDAGNIIAGVGGQIGPNPVDPGTPPVLGSLYNDGPVPDPGLDVGNVTAVVAGNFINQAVMAAFQAGLTHITIINEQLLFGTEVLSTDMGNNGDVRIRVVPSAPAQMTLHGEQVAAATLQLYNFDVYLEKKSNGAFSPMLALKLEVRVPITLGVNSDNAIVVAFLTDPQIDILALDNSFGFIINTQMVNDVIDVAVPALLDAVGRSLLTIELPTLGGFGIRPDEIKTVGDNNENLSFSGSLFTAP